jgi:hypothetical protein
MDTIIIIIIILITQAEEVLLMPMELTVVDILKTKDLLLIDHQVIPLQDGVIQILELEMTLLL